MTEVFKSVLFLVITISVISFLVFMLLKFRYKKQERVHLLRGKSLFAQCGCIYSLAPPGIYVMNYHFVVPEKILLNALNSLKMLI